MGTWGVILELASTRLNASIASLLLCWNLCQCDLGEYDEYWYLRGCQFGKFCLNLVNFASFAMFWEFGENKLECSLHAKYLFYTENNLSYIYLPNFLDSQNLPRALWILAKLANTCKIWQSNIRQTCQSCESLQMSNLSIWRLFTKSVQVSLPSTTKDFFLNGIKIYHLSIRVFLWKLPNV